MADWALKSTYARLGFWVPTALAIVAALVGIVLTWNDTSGYGGLIFIVFMIGGGLLGILWAIVGSIIAWKAGPPGAGRQFAAGAVTAIAAALVLFSATCWGTLIV